MSTTLANPGQTAGPMLPAAVTPLPSGTTQATAAASNSAALAVIVVVQWLLSMRGVNLPADVATALGVLLAALVHSLVAARVKGQAQ